jgi:superfamily I DNA and/or RNA helicase
MQRHKQLQRFVTELRLFIKQLSSQSSGKAGQTFSFALKGQALCLRGPTKLSRPSWRAQLKRVPSSSSASTQTCSQRFKAAKSIVLLGDPQQLDQPQRGVHPPGAEASALSHLLNGRATIAEDQGLFLAESWRLHPDICAFTSEAFYDNRLMPRPENVTQRLNVDGPFDGTGLRFVPVKHDGNQSESPEESARVAEIVRQLLRDGSTWTNKKGETVPLLLKHILIVAPYNAQVSALAQSLPDGARVGTVDKFQGQEAPVVIYSMTTSTPEDAPRGMEFLYSSNRLNVATSRAQCLTVLVASPALFEVQCKTPRQIELANAFCRYLEMAANRANV